MISNSTRLSVNDNNVNKNTKNGKTNFKGIGTAVLNGTGQAMNSIENGGFVASFLIQDTLGMTVPRTREGLYRDRDKHVKFKDMNFKEAGEVFIREFLSGPLMMFTPFLVFALTKKFMGKSTFNHTGLIKKLGNNFTEAVKNKKANDTVKVLKENFYRNTLDKMIEGTTPNAPGKSEFIDKIYAHVNKLDELESQLTTAKGKSFKDKILNIFKPKSKKIQSERDIIKAQISETKGNMLQELNDFHTSNSTEFGLVNKIKLNNDVYGANESIEAMRNYAFDAIKGDDATKFTEETAKKFSKQTFAKRIFATVAASLGTIGSTSIVPALYTILNPVPPGAMDNACYNPEHEHTPEPKNKQNTTAANKSGTANTDKKGAVQFKGNILKQLQFDGNQLTPLLMTTLAAGGLIVPRVHTAVKRAPIDEDGKKNLIEVPEILTRDIVSTTAVTFGVPILSKAMVNTYEKASGFVLTNKPEKEMSTFKKVLDIINPLSEIGPYSNKDLKSIYGHIENKAQLTNLTQFIDKRGGNLVKVFKSLKNGKESFAGTAADFDAISKLDKKTANSKIMEVIASSFDDNAVKKLMEPAKAGKINGMLQRARGLNSAPKMLNTLVLVPVFLGVVLPKIVYGITAKNRQKLELAKKEKMQNKQHMAMNMNQTQNKPVQNLNHTAFEQLKKHTN